MMDVTMTKREKRESWIGAEIGIEKEKGHGGMTEDAENCKDTDQAVLETERGEEDGQMMCALLKGVGVR